jgi:hypothetical protein
MPTHSCCTSALRAAHILGISFELRGPQGAADRRNPRHLKATAKIAESLFRRATGEGPQS